MSDELLVGAHAEAFLSAAMVLARDAASTPTWFETSVRALEAAYSERPLLPAPTLAFDLTALLHGERLLPVAAAGIASIRDALRGYEDHVLARLLADRRWTRLTEALIAQPKEYRAAAVGLITAQLLARLRLSEGTGVSPGVVRRFASRLPDEVRELGRTSLYDEDIAKRVAQGLNQLAQAARRTRELLSDAEVFLMENLSALKGLGARVALAQLAEVAQSVDERLPTRLRGDMGDEGDAPTTLEVEAAYPVGGFSSISTHGAVENLVTSELIYMEHGDEPHARPDLFDVRFVENELLYYARDESVAVRKKRVLTLIFDASLQRARVKDSGEMYQRLVWLMGSVTALVRKLSQWLSAQALVFELTFVKEGEEAPLAEEEGVMGLLLREYRERGQVHFHHASSSFEAVRAAREQHRQRAHVVVLSTKMPVGLEGDATADVLVDAGGAHPKVHWAKARPERESTAMTALEAWAETTRQLLEALLNRPAIGRR